MQRQLPCAWCVPGFGQPSIQAALPAWRKQVAGAQCRRLLLLLGGLLRGAGGMRLPHGWGLLAACARQQEGGKGGAVVGSLQLGPDVLRGHGRKASVEGE